DDRRRLCRIGVDWFRSVSTDIDRRRSETKCEKVWESENEGKIVNVCWICRSQRDTGKAPPVLDAGTESPENQWRR
ncbi:hypothetical protein KI387_003647, partial [Taxus chinensis]